MRSEAGRIFISYAREDIAFVHRFHDALEDRGRKSWVDWEGIPPSDKWLARIRAAIDEADDFVFVISPDSVTSEVSGVEVDHANKQHKRLIPAMHREVEEGTVRRELAELNYIFAREEDPFDSASRESDATEVSVWSTADCSRRLRVLLPGRQERVALGADGNYLVASGRGSTVHIWEVATGTEVSLDLADLVFAFAISPDGRRLATMERDRGERRYWVRIRDLAEDRDVREWEHFERSDWLQWGPRALVVGSRETAAFGMSTPRRQVPRAHSSPCSSQRSQPISSLPAMIAALSSERARESRSSMPGKSLRSRHCIIGTSR